jgi:hypothetical protein
METSRAKIASKPKIARLGRQEASDVGSGNLLRNQNGKRLKMGSIEYLQSIALV